MRKTLWVLAVFVPWTLVVPAIFGLFLKSAQPAEKEEPFYYGAELDQSVIKKDGPLRSLALAIFVLFDAIPQTMDEKGLTKKYNDFDCAEALVVMDVNKNTVRITLSGVNTNSDLPWQKINASRSAILEQLQRDLSVLGEQAQAEGAEKYFITEFLIKRGQSTEFKFIEIKIAPQEPGRPLKSAPPKADPPIPKKHPEPSMRPEHARAPSGALCF